MNFLVTGANGFLGKAMVNILKNNHTVETLGKSSANKIVADITLKLGTLDKYDVVVHVAGKAHSIPKAGSEIEEFHLVNTQGTINLLNALQPNLPELFVFVSTVAVYGCDEGENIDEQHPLQGSSPYALSKVNAEKKVIDWCERNDVNYVILRLPLISGKSAPGNLNKMTKAIRLGYYLRIGEGRARKSMVGADSVAELIPKLIDKRGIYNLTDGIHPQVSEIEECISNQLNEPIRKLPIWVISLAAKIGDIISFLPINSERLKKLTASLTFDDSKARSELDWNPEPALKYLSVSSE